jgi:hypothetical protein
VLQVPRQPNHLPGWMTLAFCAGHKLGCRAPDRLEDVLPGPELKAALHRLKVIRLHFAEENFTLRGMSEAAGRIVTRHWPDVNAETIESVLFEIVLKSSRAGFAAATAAQFDPSYSEFVSDIKTCIDESSDEVSLRGWMNAARRSVGKPVADLLRHPLIRLVDELYPLKNKTPKLISKFFNQRLKAIGVHSENECPSGDANLIEWIADGLRFGQLVKTQHPSLLERVYWEHGDRQLGKWRTMYRDVIAKTGGLYPEKLLVAFKELAAKYYGIECEPFFYGQHLSRVLYVTDFAIWLPWAMDGWE